MSSSPLISPVRKTFHAVVTIPIVERYGAALPVLIIGDGDEAAPSQTATAYLRNKQQEGLDGSTLLKHAKAIGLLYDLYIVEFGGRPLLPEELVQLIRRFWESRRNGNPKLGWSSVTWSVASDDLAALTAYSDFCEREFGHAPLNPGETVLVASVSHSVFRTWLARKANRKETDLLYHIHESTKEGQGLIEKRDFRPAESQKKKVKKPVVAAKHFPPPHVLLLIEKSTSIRNRLCWLLVFFGGIRTSELLHIFVEDITLDEDGTARVVLGHPADGQMSWAKAGKRKRGNRRQFLLDIYETVPRNDLASTHPLHAGWKGMLMDEAGKMESIVNWSNPDMGRLFWTLHKLYMRKTRVPLGDLHPYYFVNLKGDDYGGPLKASAIRDAFYRNVERIGLSAREAGVNPHGARHFYGWYCANVLRLTKERTQKLIHHRSMESTEVYYTLDKSTVREEVAKAHAAMQKYMPAFLQNQTLLADNSHDED